MGGGRSLSAWAVGSPLGSPRTWSLALQLRSKGSQDLEENEEVVGVAVLQDALVAPGQDLKQRDDGTVFLSLTCPPRCRSCISPGSPISRKCTKC